MYILCCHSKEYSFLQQRVELFKGFLLELLGEMEEFLVYDASSANQ